VAYFEIVAKAVNDGKTAANRMSDLVFPALSERKWEIDEFPIGAAQFADFVIKTGPLSKQDRVDLMKHMLDNNVDLAAAMDATGIKPAIVDEGALRTAVCTAIAGNPKAVADFKKGKDAAKMSIVGAVMKANKGVPNDVVRRLVDEELAKV
jgi:aspartyl-tRNA(Asn)/glutamyl-tRNA(Gln) amidotransferase subunit B